MSVPPITQRCPFCGTGAVEVWRCWTPPENYGGREWAVYCSACRVIGPSGETPEEAINLWNSRSKT